MWSCCFGNEDKQERDSQEMLVLQCESNIVSNFDIFVFSSESFSGIEKRSHRSFSNASLDVFMIGLMWLFCIQKDLESLMAMLLSTEIIVLIIVDISAFLRVFILTYAKKVADNSFMFFKNQDYI